MVEDPLALWPHAADYQLRAPRCRLEAQTPFDLVQPELLFVAGPTRKRAPLPVYGHLGSHGGRFGLRREQARYDVACHPVELCL